MTCSIIPGEVTDSESLSASWHDAFFTCCGPITVDIEKEEKQDEKLRNEASSDIVKDDSSDDSSISAWDEAVNLLCRAMVVDEDWEEEETLERMRLEHGWELRCSMCTCGDADDVIIDDDSSVD